MLSGYTARFRFLAVIACILALNCCGPLQKTQLTGFVVSKQANEIVALNLRTHEETTLLDSHETEWLHSLVPGPPGKILFTSGFYLDGIQVFEFDLCSGETRRLGNGQDAVYDEEHDALLYFESNQGAIPDNPALLLAPYADLGNAVPILRGPPIRVMPKGIMIPLLKPPVRISEGRYVTLAENFRLHLVDIERRTATDLGIPCLPLVLRTATNTLLCTDWNPNGLKNFEIDIDDGWKRKESALTSSRPIYIEPEDTVVYGTVSGRLLPIPHEISQLHAYRFDRGLYYVSDSYLYDGYWSPSDPLSRAPCGRQGRL